MTSKKLSDIINETDYTRSAIGWGIGLASILGRGYLLQRIGGRLIHQATTYDIIGFSILQIFQIAKGTDPASWSEDTRRRFARLSPEYDIVDTMSLMILPSVVSNYRLERIKQLQNETGSLSHSIREQSDILSGNDSDGGTKNVAGLHIEMARLRSKFLGEIVDLKNEFDRLDDVLKFSSDYLLSKDADNNPVEKAFVHPPEASDHVVKYSLQDITQINGVLSKFVQDSKSIKQEATNTLNKVEEEQTTIVSHINGLLNINLQKRLENLTRNISRYTKWLIILTVLLIILAAASICVMVWQPFT